MILGRKIRNLSRISSEELFFREHHNFGIKIGLCFKIKHNFLSYSENIACPTHQLPLKYPITSPVSAYQLYDPSHRSPHATAI